jgi:hypothetical protein
MCVLWLHVDICMCLVLAFQKSESWKLEVGNSPLPYQGQGVIFRTKVQSWLNLKQRVMSARIRCMCVVVTCRYMYVSCDCMSISVCVLCLHVDTTPTDVTFLRASSKVRSCPSLLMSIFTRVPSLPLTSSKICTGTRVNFDE